MDKAEIIKLLNAAKVALNDEHLQAITLHDSHNAQPNLPSTIKTKVTEKASFQYRNCATRIFQMDILNPSEILNIDADKIINTIQGSNKKSTLRFYARSIRYVSMLALYARWKLADTAQRCGDWSIVEDIVRDSNFAALTKLSAMLPSDYTKEWQPIEKRKGKKSSISRLPEDWREQMFAASSGQYKLPMLVSLITGCRPAELQKGVTFKYEGNKLVVGIKGAKVKSSAGQEYRVFAISDHPLKESLINLLTFDEKNVATVIVGNGNSVTTHMRLVAKKLWPRRKESITMYSARHAMAADCKVLGAKIGDPDLVSKVLGHCVDKTASYYGSVSQSGEISVAPMKVKVEKAVRQKSKPRTKNRNIYSQNKKTPVIK